MNKIQKIYMRNKINDTTKTFNSEQKMGGIIPPKELELAESAAIAAAATEEEK